jgi:hypothetical protein
VVAVLAQLEMVRNIRGIKVVDAAVHANIEGRTKLIDDLY